jgi:PAS domain S-box-containing protein
LNDYEMSNLQNKIKTEFEVFSNQFDSDLNNTFISLQRMSKIFEYRQDISEHEFMINAQSYLSYLPGVKSIIWADSLTTVKWVSGTENTGSLIKKDLSFEKRRSIAFEKARTMRSLTISEPVELLQGGSGFLVIMPTFVDDHLKGYLLAAVRFSDWFDFRINKMNRADFLSKFSVSFLFDNKPVYTLESNGKTASVSSLGEMSISLPDHTINILFKPTSKLIKISTTKIPAFTLTFGCVVSILIACIVYLLQNAYIQKWKLQFAKESLENEIAERRKTDNELQQILMRAELAAKAGNIGIWTWNIDTNELQWNDRMYDLFDIPEDVKPTYNTWRDAVHKDDIVTAEKLLMTAVDGKAVFDTEFRIVHSDCSIHYIRAAARVERDLNGMAKNVTGLNWDITHHRQTEIDLQHLSEMQKIIMEISSQNINVPSEKAPDAIHRAIKRMGEFVQSDRTYVFSYDFVNNVTTNTYEWCNNGVSPQKDRLQNISLENLKSWVESHQAGEPVFIADVPGLEDGTLKELLMMQDIKSLVAVPMLNGKELTGFVGFDSVKMHRVYLETEISLLKIFAQTLVNIHSRIHFESAIAENEARIRLMINSTAEAIYGIDMNGNCTFANDRCAKILGYENTEVLLGKNMHNLIHHSYQDKTPMNVEVCKIYNAFRNGLDIHVDDEVLWRADGSCFPSEYWSYPQKVNGQVTGAVVTFVDITERLNVARKLDQTRQNYETFFNTINDFLFVLDDKGNILHVNTTVIDRLGYSRDELSGKSILMVHPPEFRDEAGRIVQEMLQGTLDMCPIPVMTKSGTYIPVETRIKAGEWDNKPVIFGVTKDISRIKLSEEMFSKVFHINPFACGLSNIDDRKLIEINEQFYYLLGFDRSEALGKTIFELGIFSKDTADEILRRADSNGKVVNVEVDLTTKNGDIKHVLLSAENIFVQDKKYRYTVVHDITEEKNTQLCLDKERIRLTSILEGTNVGTWEWNVQSGKTVFNERWAEIVGYSLKELEPVSIATWKNLAHPDDLETSSKLLGKHFSNELEYYECAIRMKHKNGEWIWVLDRGKVATWTEDKKPLLMCGTHQDVTKEKIALVEKEKLIEKLEKALSEVKMLSGMLPICASCKRIRDDKGYWNQIELYIKEHSDAEFTHGMCPECARKLYPDIFPDDSKRNV